jgi:ABC-2 type transport system permease protein
MAVFLTISNYNIYKLLAHYPDVAKSFFISSMSIFSLFYVVGFIGTGMHAFSRSDEMELLLTMPISRSVLTVYNLIVTLANQFFTLGFFVASVLGFLLAVRTNIFGFILRTLLHIAFLTSLSALLAVVSGGISSKRFVRRLNAVILLLLVAVYLFFVQIQDVNVEQLGENARFVKFVAFTTSKYNPFNWSYSDDRLLLISVIILTGAFLYSFWYFAERVVYENTHAKKEKNKPNEVIVNQRTYASKFGGFLWKDLKLLSRSEQFVFLIFYPAVFSFFMLFAGGSSMNAAIPFLAIASLYCAIEAGLLTRNDFEYREILRTLPVTTQTIITPKLAIPIILNESLLIIVAVISYIFGKFEKNSLFLFPLSIAIFGLSALIGSYYSIVDPGKTKNNPFSLKATFIIEGIVLGLSFGLPITLTIILAKPSLTTWKFYAVWLTFIGSLIALIILMMIYYRKLKHVLTQKD